MIYTCTANPSMDYTIFLDNELEIGSINRAETVTLLAGGKGLNASMILNQLGIESTAIVFLGGFIGEAINKELKKYQLIHCEPVLIQEESRINVKLRDTVETDINLKGPHITSAERTAFLNRLNNLQIQDWVLVCGSLVFGLDFSFLEEIAKKVHFAHAKLVLDTSFLTLTQLKILSPYLIKPNLDELQLLFPQTPITNANLIDMTAEIISANVKNLVVSLGSQGAFYTGEYGHYIVQQPQVNVVNTVGAGDSMLAAFVSVLSRNGSIEDALKLGAAAGAATVASIGLSQSDEIFRLLQQCTVTKLDDRKIDII